jgi:hypothetical protein
METMTRKDFGIAAHMNFAIIVVAKNPIKFAYMTAEDRVYGVGEVIPHEGPRFFARQETAEATKDRLEAQGLYRVGVFGRYMVAKPGEFEVRILTVEEFLALKNA